MHQYTDIDPQPVPVRLSPLFEARWSYEEFVRLMPFGPDAEGQAYAYATPDSRVDGERVSGSLRLVQLPRWRSDGLYLPDAHGLIETPSGDHVAFKAGGFGIPAPGEAGKLTVTHWMRLWTGARELAWLNSTVAVGVGVYADEIARVRYYVAAPASEPSAAPPGAPALELLGTARWQYSAYEAVRPFGDEEGAGFATSVGDVVGEVLAGRWRGWHYPSYLCNGVYQVDAHAEIGGPDAPIVMRHAGLATPPATPSGDVTYDVVQYATFVAAAPQLAHLNRTLALGVGYVRAPGLVTCTYFRLNAPASGA